MEGAERFRVLISRDALADRIAELGARITEDYRGRELVLVAVLKGASLFLADLCRAIDLPLTIDFLGLSSYGDHTTSSGVVRLTQDLSQPIADRHVLVVEDIVDTGLTLAYLRENLRTRHPASVRVCALLDKPIHRRVEVAVDYTGFRIEDQFVVGYGLDYEQRFRNLDHIAYLPREGQA